ncbi:NGG1p interacting factor NIF3 [Oleiphilus sp. HI0009]|uniref:NGG1p interacting factor NIF3 n=2 Tax=Oleiphilus TaxID=141450 RepID=UPI0007C3D341|nr:MULTISPECIES: NGG1p interacting factor NIF3 [unclassified Oleiphilus]KZX82826.1 NGG1p interacting factor NIF3 [Oleiphilus sp. HI0009]MCH2157537.1 NGG1p interacting factor NIF3 [Oleiphilaceae bacterium]KZX84066.1 NGG1p interacting factor NIF3 [Oleiphilus sp. HI0009]KZY66597.1 NGG1p interacting factor NIF3 [Oleiphilus sp. HI0066]KZY67735.1 NGG1p interacting factor NIF3 [Oleiphilus sp. HI0067]
MSIKPDYFLSFYVPVTDCDFVKKSVFAAGAGRIGNYEHCSFETRGIGQFKPIGLANPTIGEVDQLSEVEEAKVDMVCSAKHIADAVQALKNAHPYEEPAYHVIKLETQF